MCICLPETNTTWLKIKYINYCTFNGRKAKFHLSLKLLTNILPDRQATALSKGLMMYTSFFLAVQEEQQQLLILTFNKK